MDWSVIGALLTAAAGVTVAAWTIVRERSPLRELERITAVLKDTPEGAPRRRELEVIRDHLSQRLNARYRAPREFKSRFTAWYFRLAGLLLLAILGANFLIEGESLDTAVIALYVVSFIVFNTLASLIFQSVKRRRAEWLEKSQEWGDVSSTDKPLL